MAQMCLTDVLFTLCLLTQARDIWGTSRNCLYQLGMWVCMGRIYLSLILKAQLTVAIAIARQVVLG